MTNYLFLHINLFISFAYFSGKRSVRSLLVTYFLVNIKITNYTWDHTVNIKLNVVIQRLQTF